MENFCLTIVLIRKLCQLRIWPLGIWFLFPRLCQGGCFGNKTYDPINLTIKDAEKVNPEAYRFFYDDYVGMPPDDLTRDFYRKTRVQYTFEWLCFQFEFPVWKRLIWHKHFPSGYDSNKQSIPEKETVNT